MTVSTTVLALIAAGVLISWVVLWSVAYQFGHSSGVAVADRELSMAAAPVMDPLVAGGSSAADTGGTTAALPPAPSARGPDRTATQPAPQAVPDRGAQPRAVLVPPEPDPRREGLNYYAIEGQLDRASAEQILLFLAEHGVEAVAVDTSQRGSNNDRSYRVYGLQGFSSTEFRTQARIEYEQRISRLGEIFRRDHRGWTDFSRTNWERYRP